VSAPVPLPVIHESAAVVAVDKPAGLAVIPGRDGPTGASVHELLQAARGERLWVVHRLDRDTSGVLVFARNASAHRTLSMAFEAGAVDKRYLALVAGALRAPARLELALVPARRGRMRPAAPGEQGKAASTAFTPREVLGDAATLVEAVPATGRTHQIRVHLRALGHPLLVDHQYGRPAPFPPPPVVPLLLRTPLHACALFWKGLPGVEDAELTAPLPPDVEAALAWLRAQPSGARAK
jgi:RluA family pseudouridine synthase